MLARLQNVSKTEAEFRGPEWNCVEFLSSSNFLFYRANDELAYVVAMLLNSVI